VQAHLNFYLLCRVSSPWHAVETSDSAHRLMITSPSLQMTNGSGQRRVTCVNMGAHQARRQEMKWGWVFFCKKVDLSSTQGALCTVSVFFILHFTYLGFQRTPAYGPARVAMRMHKADTSYLGKWIRPRDDKYRRRMVSVM